MTGQELTITQKTQQAIDFFRSEEISIGLREAMPENVSFHQFQRALNTALLKDPDLVDADRSSLVEAALRCAQDGLLPDGKHAVLNVYNTKVKRDGKDVWIKKVTYVPMVEGVRAIAGEYGWSLNAFVVHENDTFDPDLDAHRANHKPARLGTDPGNIIGAYAIAEHRDGRRVGPLVMSRAEIEKVRDESSKQKSGKLWTVWFDRACKKTVAKRLCKELPFDTKDRARINMLLAADDTNGDEAADAMYGQDFDPQSGEVFEPVPDEADDGPADQPEPEEGEWSDSEEQKPTDEQPAFEGDEPPAPTIPAIQLTATFGSGRYAGKTVEQIWDLGDEGSKEREAGRSYIKWALGKWKTGDIVNDLNAFAASHQEELA